MICKRVNLASCRSRAQRPWQDAAHNEHLQPSASSRTLSSPRQRQYCTEGYHHIYRVSQKKLKVLYCDVIKTVIEYFLKLKHLL